MTKTCTSTHSTILQGSLTYVYVLRKRFFHLCNEVDTQKHAHTQKTRWGEELLNSGTTWRNAFLICSAKRQVVSVSTILVASESTSCTSGVSYRFDRSHEGQWMNLCYGLRVPWLTEVLLKLVEVLWVCFIQNMRKLALIIIVVIMRETVEK